MVSVIYYTYRARLEAANGLQWWRNLCKSLSVVCSVATTRRPSPRPSKRCDSVRRPFKAADRLLPQSCFVHTELEVSISVVIGIHLKFAVIAYLSLAAEHSSQSPTDLHAGSLFRDFWDAR
jgi:hypothetical protein